MSRSKVDKSLESMNSCENRCCSIACSSFRDVLAYELMCGLVPIRDPACGDSRFDRHVTTLAVNSGGRSFSNIVSKLHQKLLQRFFK